MVSSPVATTSSAHGQAITSVALTEQLAELGYQARLLPVGRLSELRRELEKRHRLGEFDEAFYQEHLTAFEYEPPPHFSRARSVLIVAVPRPQIQLRFHWQGRIWPLLVPSFYLRWAESGGQLDKHLRRLLSPAGYRFVPAAVPQKLLAVRSGLAEYGRNNVSYVSGMGSYLRLASFFTDLPCQDDPWQEARLLAKCQHCVACVRKCPTGAITSNRFLLQAERCITFHNEQPGDRPFPAWMKPAIHNALLGCSQCQNYCPENKLLRRWIEVGPEFSEYETALLLGRTPVEDLPAETVSKLEYLDLVKYLDLLPRNLAVLFTHSQQ